MVIDAARGFRNASELASQSIGGRKLFLSDSPWNLIKDLFPSPPKSPKGGPTPVTSRDCLEGILWILKSGARWKDLPE
ncbi:MAG: transposase, partial [Fuerstiella sp.]